MHVIHARNVNDAYRKGLRLISQEGQLAPSRNGNVLRVDVPVTTVYSLPHERVLFDAQRNANPFFHLFEALWMLNGQNDVETMDQFLPSFKQFSDDGKTYRGAYGRRWREHFNNPLDTFDFPQRSTIDQLAKVITMLKINPNDRRAIVSMWDPSIDLAVNGKDIPCNDMIKFRIVNGALDIHIFNRSNDVVYGCYGANAVHMSFLQEYMAAMIGVPMGCYWQISTDFHAYMNVPYDFATYYPLQDNDGGLENDWTDDDVVWENPYSQMESLITFPLVSRPDTFDRELGEFMLSVRQKSAHCLPGATFDNRFFAKIAMPMYDAFINYKNGQTEYAISVLREAQIWEDRNDWLFAGQQWLERRVR